MAIVTLAYYYLKYICWFLHTFIYSEYICFYSYRESQAWLSGS